MSADAAGRLGRAAMEAMEALSEIRGLDLERHAAAVRALREVWAVSCEARDPAYFAKLAVSLADGWGCQPADLYRAMTPVELLDAHTQLAETGEEP